jgi:hypothetical protein
MNLNEMQNAWNSPKNSLPASEQQQLAERFTRRMIRRRRFQAIWLTNTYVWLTLITLAVGQTVASGKLNPAQEWAAFPLIIAPWILAIYFLRQYLKPAAPIVRGELSIAESFRVALDSNQVERKHLKLVAMLFAIVIPFLAVSVRQLHAAGKVSSRELASMAIFFGAVLLVSGAGIAARYFGRVLPQGRKLNALLAELGADVQ